MKNEGLHTGRTDDTRSLLSVTSPDVAVLRASTSQPSEGQLILAWHTPAHRILDYSAPQHGQLDAEPSEGSDSVRQQAWDGGSGWN